MTIDYNGKRVFGRPVKTKTDVIKDGLCCAGQCRIYRVPGWCHRLAHGIRERLAVRIQREDLDDVLSITLGRGEFDLRYDREITELDREVCGVDAVDATTEG